MSGLNMNDALPDGKINAGNNGTYTGSKKEIDE